MSHGSVERWYAQVREVDSSLTRYMTSDSQTLDSGITTQSLRTQFPEDPRREPHEKETALHVEGEGTHFSVTSFKKVVFAKLLRRPEFRMKHIHVLDNGRERIVRTLDEAAADSSLIIIGVQGRLPVGCVNIGTPRNSDSYAEIVK